MQNVIINGNIYEGVQKVQIPLSNGGGNADFVDTSGATAKAENIDKGFNAFVDGALVVGTKETVQNSFNNIGTFNVQTNGDGHSYIEGVLTTSTKIYPYTTGSYNGLGLFYIVPKYIDTTYTGVQLMSCYISPAYLGEGAGNTNMGGTFHCLGVTVTEGVITSISNGTTMAVGTYSIENDKIYLSNGVSVPCGEVYVYEVIVNFQ